MKKQLLLLIITIFFVSCKITEQVEIKEDGSISYQSEFNFTEMMAMMYDENTKDSLRNIGEFPIDTIMKFSDLEQYSNMTSDSLSHEEKEFMKSLDRMQVRMVMNDSEGKMGIGFEEKNVHAFNKFFEEMNAAMMKLPENGGKSFDEMTQTGFLSPFKIHYDGKRFERISTVNNAWMNEMNDSTLAATKQMLGMFTYKLQYKFPKRIKSTTLENASLSVDGKTIFVEFPAIKLLEEPNINNFTVEFE